MNGRNFLVTGGNRGLGLELCRLLVAAGGNVVLTSRQLAAGEAVAQELCQQRPGCAVALQLDAADPDSVAGLLDQIKTTFNRKINTLVNNAGAPGRTWDRETFDAVVRTNCTGPVQLALGIAPLLAPGGSIVMVSSELGQFANLSAPYRTVIESASSVEELAKSVVFEADSAQASIRAPVYCLSKAMLNRATQLLAEDQRLVEQAITINAVCPGWCRTSMGGPRAGRSAQQGAASILWMVQHARDINGGFFQDGRPLPW